MFNPIIDHVQKALARLLTQYQGATRLQSLLTAMIDPIQEIEDVLQSMNIDRYLAAAVGVQLDNIGDIVGLPRPTGMGDEQYRLHLYGQIKVNTSEGQPEQLIQIYQLLTQAVIVLLFEEFPAEFIIASDYTPPDQATTDDLIDIVKSAAPAGVRNGGIIAFSLNHRFAYAGRLVSQGYGTVSDPLQGGGYGGLHRHS